MPASQFKPLTKRQFGCSGSNRQGFDVLLVGNAWQGLGRVRFTLPGGVVESGEVAPEGLLD